MQNSMRILIALCFGGSIPVATWAGPYDDGVAAYGHEDYAEALRLLRPLAVGGAVGAQLLVGDMYEAGDGTTKDYVEALKWYHLAAAQGAAPAEYHLGEMYEKGEGTGKDVSEALHWYRLAESQADKDGDEDLADSAGAAIIVLSPGN